MNIAKAEKEFISPPSEFSPVPFWFWNDVLSKEEIHHQIDEFISKGITAFVIHPRIGLPDDMDYLSDEFMGYVKYAVNYAGQNDMKVVLYDEGMYPSGSAHGGVVRANPEFASKGLRMIDSDAVIDGRVIAEHGEHIFVLVKSGGTIRGIHYGEDDNEAHAPASADLLNPAAVHCFISLTHDRYYRYLKSYFGRTVTAFFTDEPNILGRCSRPGLIPWTDDFLDYYLANGGKISDLSMLFADGNNEEKQRYHAIVYRRLSESYYLQLSRWCNSHGIALTGHPENSDDIGYLKYFDIPCQDIVWRYVAPENEKYITGPHSTMGKCSSDSARHRGKRRNGNECFGACGEPGAPFKFTRDDMKWYLDWLFVRGVNCIYPHAFFYSIRDERKAERPPDVGMHSTFWSEYSEICLYIKRMCWLLTDSVNQTRIAILCSYDYLSWKIARPLFEHQIEFNYLEKELLPECTVRDGSILIRNQQYRIIIVEGALDTETERLLTEYTENGICVMRFNEQNFMSDLRKRYKPDMYIEPENRYLRKTHVIKYGIHFFLLTNEGEDLIDTVFYCTFGMVFQVWDAETGLIVRCPVPKNEYRVYLEKRKSIVLVIGSNEDTSIIHEE